MGHVEEQILVLSSKLSGRAATIGQSYIA